MQVSPECAALLLLSDGRTVYLPRTYSSYMFYSLPPHGTERNTSVVPDYQEFVRSRRRKWYARYCHPCHRSLVMVRSQRVKDRHFLIFMVLCKLTKPLLPRPRFKTRHWRLTPWCHEVGLHWKWIFPIWKLAVNRDTTSEPTKLYGSPFSKRPTKNFHVAKDHVLNIWIFGVHKT